MNPTPSTPAEITIAPLNWRGAMPILIAAMQDGTPEGQRMAKAELMGLAERLDAANAAEATPAPIGAASRYALPEWAPEGFTVHETGGGCLAVALERDGMQWLVTNDDGTALPEDGETALCGCYDIESGDEISLAEFPRAADAVAHVLKMSAPHALPNWAREHPDFVRDMPDNIPAEWWDMAWRNDLCVIFISGAWDAEGQPIAESDFQHGEAGEHIQIQFERVRPEDREDSSAPRFGVYRVQCFGDAETPDHWETLYSGEDFADAIDATRKG